MTITTPSAGELALNTGEVLCKLPTDALHNQLHKLAETSRETRENLEATELAALLLCALELEHQKKVHHGEPWKQWVKSNCTFGYTTVTKYARVLKAARIGAIKNLDPGIVPETAPSVMSQDELRDAGNGLANALQGLGGIRQLYLQLEIISLPGGKKPKPGDGAGEDPAPSAPSESADIEALFVKPLRPLTRLFEQRKHLKLQPAQARELEGILKSYLDDLKLIK
jgi:hypothetical protein